MCSNQDQINHLSFKNKATQGLLLIDLEMGCFTHIFIFVILLKSTYASANRPELGENFTILSALPP
jgi:hypothetical protein